MSMLFDVVGQRYVSIMVHSTPSTNIICIAVHYEINQNLTADPKELIIFHQ